MLTSFVSVRDWLLIWSFLSLFRHFRSCHQPFTSVPMFSAPAPHFSDTGSGLCSRNYVQLALSMEFLLAVLPSFLLSSSPSITFDHFLICGFLNSADIFIPVYFGSSQHCPIVTPLPWSAYWLFHLFWSFTNQERSQVRFGYRHSTKTPDYTKNFDRHTPFSWLELSASSHDMGLVHRCLLLISAHVKLGFVDYFSLWLRTPPYLERYQVHTFWLFPPDKMVQDSPT